MYSPEDFWRRMDDAISALDGPYSPCRDVDTRKQAEAELNKALICLEGTPSREKAIHAEEYLLHAEELMAL